MENFVKIVNPCKCHTWRKRPSDAFAKITYADGKLSITGVIGPYASGNCAGSAGQCVDEIRKGKPVDGWTREMLNRFCDAWDKWHLNDMRAYCAHQKELGWDEMAHEPMTLYHYKLNSGALKKQSEAKDDAVQHLKTGVPFVPSPEQTFYANLQYFLNIYTPIDEERGKYYEPHKDILTKSTTETKTRGWVRFDEDERGILCRPCPVCGYKYGSAWLKEDVPEDVLEFLRGLPDTKVRPAWV